MKRAIFFASIIVPFLAAGQDTTRLKPLPEFTYITPEMNKHRLDSLILALRPYELYLGFDTVIYDGNKRIKQVSGSLEAKTEYFPLSSTNFKGITILNRRDTITVIMGILRPPPKK
jgi:hypothetical protein